MWGNGKGHVEPGRAALRGPVGYLWWLVVRQWPRVVAGAVLGSVWMVLLTAAPYVLSRAIDDGLTPGDFPVLAGWAAALLGVGILDAWLGIMRHRTMTRVRMDANLRTVRVLIGQSVRLGAALQRHATTGGVATIGTGDVRVISQALTVTGPGVGAVITCVVVAALLFAVSGLLAVVVLVGVPLLLLVIGPLLGRLHGATTTYRTRQGMLTTRFVDMACGLRILSGLGGKDVVRQRYRQESRAMLDDGYRVGDATSWIEAVGAGLPALFLAAVTWLAARMVAQGGISVGELVAVYGYVAVLGLPVAFLIEGASDTSRALVAARHVVAFLNLQPDRAGDGDAPRTPSVLHDPASGVTVHPGRLTALVSARTADAVAVIDRLGGFVAGDATWGGIALAGIAPRRIRERILVADAEADLFAGPLREVVAGHRDPDCTDGADEAALARAVHTAMADDVVAGLPAGLDAVIDAQGLNLSGGQRQRVRLVRALLADPEVLMAVEPTSALDAHTEAAVAARLREDRAGRTTVVTSTSPLLLTHADTVHYLTDGRIAATGTHRELLAASPGYRQLVSRGSAEDGAEDSTENGAA
ncbi:ABC transporter transmembrane domain-containing protein [Pseudonocardia sp. GCM10023141]|uniref:ABC transporter transmembrane domain-containing protein n=1 Tax=Pseudonocardia sp. GCM10023141 TaxID=3252653 RepID=UPI00360A5AAB